MTAQASADRGAAPAPVAPATIVRVLVRPLTKILNPPMVRLAGRRFFPMAQIHHVGRRSGKAYVTSASAHIRGDVLLIGLTFGNQSDWSRNVRAAGGCTVRLARRGDRQISPVSARPKVMLSVTPTDGMTLSDGCDPGERIRIRR